MSLAQVSIFTSLPNDQLDAVRRLAEFVEISAGEKLFVEGEDTRDFYVVLEGELLVTLRPHGLHDPIDVGSLVKSDTLGEIGLLLDEPRTATVTAIVSSVVVRLSTGSVEKLAEIAPQFAFALARELAKRLKTSYYDKNLLEATAIGAAVPVSVPDVSKARSYMTSYYSTVLRNVMGRHQLFLKSRSPAYRTNFRYKSEYQRRWFELFNASEAEQAAPFTYYTQNGAFVVMRILDDLGINFRHLLHLKSEMMYSPDHPQLIPDTTYVTTTSITDVISLQGHQVVLVCQSRFELSGALVLTVKDYFAVRNLDANSLKMLANNKHYGKGDRQQFGGIRRRRPTLDPATSVAVSYELASDAGVRFGRISGDLNPVHTTAAAARLFGYSRPFVQGLFTGNMVLKHLAGVTTELITVFAITFSNRAVLGQSMRLAWSRGSFEVCDAKGILIAFGTYR